jgi:hypothetical protein
MIGWIIIWLFILKNRYLKMLIIKRCYNQTSFYKVSKCNCELYIYKKFHETYKFFNFLLEGYDF